MNNLVIFLFFLVAAIPGIYLALRNNFVIFNNKNCNNFFMRAIYTVPLTTGLVLLPCLPITLFFPIIFSGITNTLMNMFGPAAVLIAPLVVGILFILFMHALFLRNDVPPEYWQDFEKYELYIYMPNIKVDGGEEYYEANFTPPDLIDLRELQKLIQPGELVIDFKYLMDKEIAYTRFGEIIVSEKALALFKNNNLTGFQEQPVHNWKDSKIKTGEKYFQLMPIHTMPAVSTETKIVKYSTKRTILFSTLLYIQDRLVYYDKSVLPVPDFNHSLEIFGDAVGSLYAPQNLWIVSHKVMRIMINDLDQRKRDFVPVILVDGKNE